MNRPLVKNIIPHRTSQYFMQTLAPIFDKSYPHGGNVDRLNATAIENLLDCYPEYTLDVYDMLDMPNPKSLSQIHNWLLNAIHRNIYNYDAQHNENQFNADY